MAADHQILDAEAPMPLAAIAGVTASIAVFAISQGLSYPYYTFLMQKQGMSPAEIGLSAAMMPLGLITSAMLVPMLVRRFGSTRLATGSALLVALLFVSVGLLQNWVAWYPVRFLIGVVVNPLYILGEVWAMTLAPPSKRGRIMGFFNAVTGAGYALGPISLALVGSEGWPPLMIGIFGFTFCGLLLALTTRGIAGMEQGPEAGEPGGMSVMQFWMTAPALLFAVLVAAANQQSIYSLMPVFGASFGLPEAQLATMISVMSIGNIVLQLPLGLMAERYGARNMILACAAMNMTAVALIALTVGGEWVWPFLLISGGVGYGVYTMAQIELGNRFSGQKLIAGNSAFGLMWGVGGIIGPPGGGAAIQNFGPFGLPVMIVALSAILIAFAYYRAQRR